MTALGTLITNSLDTATLAAELYCTTTCLDRFDREYQTTTVVCAISTALNNIELPDNVIIVRDAQSYVESMSTEQLVELEQLLLEKELTFEENTAPVLTEESGKVYTKSGHKQL